jgi:hypothetical protein
MQNAPSPIEPESVFAGLRWTPILLGGALDNFLSMLVMLPLTFVFAGTDALSGDEEKSAQAIDQVIASPEFLLASLVTGTAITVFAGYWAASRAGQKQLQHGGWTAVSSAAIALLLLVALSAPDDPPIPLWYQVAGWLVILPAGLAGGWIASEKASPAA